MSSVTIYPSVKPGRWVLSIVVRMDNGQDFVRRKTFKRIVDALHMAQALRLHVDNAASLPVSKI